MLKVASALITIAALMVPASPCAAIGEFVMKFKVPEINSLTVGDDGRIYAACNDGPIRVYSPEGEHLRDIAPISGVFRYPTSIFHYGGKLYLTDLWYSHVAVLDTDGHPLFHFGGAGNGPKRFTEPSGVFVWNGLIYVADHMGGTVQVFGPNGVYMGRLSAQTTARGLLTRPLSVAVDDRGYVYVADISEMRVKIYDERWKFLDELRKPRFANFVSAFPGGLIASDGTVNKIGILNRERNIIGMVGYMGDADDEFLGVGSAAFDSKGRLVAADTIKQDIKIYRLPGVYDGEARKPDFTPGHATWTEDLDLSGDVLPAKAVRMPDGSLLVVDYGGKALIEVRGGRVDKVLRVPGWSPVSLAVGPKGDIWVVDGALKRVLRLSPDGEIISTIGGAGTSSAKPGEAPAASPERLMDPSDILVTAGGEIMVADTGAGKVNVYNGEGRYLGRLGRGGTSAFITKPISLDSDEKGTIYVLDSSKPSIILYSDRGAYIREIGGYGAEREIMQTPVALRMVGDEIAVLDGGSNTLRIITKSGDLLMQFGSSGDGMGEFNAPLGVVDLGEGHLVISDTGNSRISYFQYVYPH